MDKVKTVILALSFITPNVSASPMSLEQVLQTVIYNYPSVQIAALQVDKANQQTAITLSKLGWRLNALMGISNDVAFTGSTVKQANLGASLEKITASGNSISLDTRSYWEVAERPFISNFSNPGTVSSVSINFRQPLQRGKGNTSYRLALANSKQLVVWSKAVLAATYNQLAGQITNLYFSAAETLSRLDNIQQAITRTERLQKFISGRLNLGIAENKDQLQVDAQYKQQIAQLKALQVIWLEQQISLNQLMGKQWDHKITTITPKSNLSSLNNMETYLQEIYLQDPQLRLIHANIAIAENQITLHREKKQNKMDLVMHIGQQVRSRDFPRDTDDYSETIGGIRIEYNKALDKSGSDAVITQAQLDKDILLQQKLQRQQEINYQVASLLAGLESAQISIKAYQSSIESENSKLKEADTRYRRGRIDIDLLLQFKAELSTAELSYVLQQIQQNRRDYRIKRLRGKIWQSVTLPKPNHTN